MTGNLKKNGTPDRRFFPNHIRKKCKSVSQKEIITQLLETLSSLIKAQKYSYEMLIALQQQILCLEAKIKILEEVYKRK